MAAGAAASQSHNVTFTIPPKQITEVIMNARQRDRAKRAARHREKLAAESRLEQRIESIMTGCSGRVSKALNGTLTLRDRSSESGAICIPDVAIYQAGHRNSRKEATHIIKG